MQRFNLQSRPVFVAALCVGIALSSLVSTRSTAQDFTQQRPTQSSNATLPTNPVPLNDDEFVKTVPQALLTQIELAKVATQEAREDRVREYASWILKDYEPALAKLQQAAAANKIDLPTTIDPPNKRLVETLQQKPAQQR